MIINGRLLKRFLQEKSTRICDFIKKEIIFYWGFWGLVFLLLVGAVVCFLKALK